MFKTLKKPFESERGMAFIISVLIVMLAVLGFIYTATRYYATMVEEAQRSRFILGAYEVIQNVGVEIRRSYDLQNPNPNCTTPSVVRNINGFQYCFRRPVCVNTPTGFGRRSQMCWNPNLAENSQSVIAKNNSLVDLFYFRGIAASWDTLKWNVGKSVVELGSFFSGAAAAQVSRDIHLPDLNSLAAAHPPASLGLLRCNGADQRHCVRCDNDSWGSQAACVRLNICIKPSTVCRPEELISQWVALIR